MPVSDIRDALRHRQRAYQPAPGAFDRLVRRRQRKERARRLSSVAVALLVMGGAVWVFLPLSRLEHLSAAPPIDRSTVGRLGVAWTVGVGDSPTVPVVDGDRVFVGTASGELYALDVRGGHVVWIGRLPASIVSAPVILGDQVVVHTTSGVLAAFETGCGTRGATCLPTWTAYTGDDVGSPPSAADGVIYVNAGDDRMLAFEGCSSGPCDPAWIGRISSYGQPRSPVAPAVADGSVWTVLGNDTVVFPKRCDRVCEPTQSQFAGEHVDRTGGRRSVGRAGIEQRLSLRVPRRLPGTVPSGVASSGGCADDTGGGRRRGVRLGGTRRGDGRRPRTLSVRPARRATRDGSAISTVRRHPR